MRILLIHQNFPGQFRQVAPVWARLPGWEVLGLGRDTAPGMPEVRWLKYKLHRDVGQGQHHYLRQIESAVLHGQAVARGLQQLKNSGYTPDVIFAHPGWGETLYARDIFPQAQVKMPNGTVLHAGDPVITYVSRNLEPYRGFHSFMRALEKIQQAHPTCHAIIVGGDDVSYGQKPKDAAHWREKMLREVCLDPTRTYFLGKVPYDTYRQILLVSAAHVYLTYPFVLSWSMLEAMASGCLVVGSRTAPVQEVIEHGVNGLLVDFFNTADMADAVVEALASPHLMRPLRDQARRDMADRYSLQQGEAPYRALLQGASSLA